MIWFEHWWGIIFDHEFLWLQKSLLDRTRHTPVKASKELCHKNFWSLTIAIEIGKFTVAMATLYVKYYKIEKILQRSLLFLWFQHMMSQKVFLLFHWSKRAMKKLQVTLIKRMSFLRRLVIFIWTSKNWEFGKKGLIFFFLVPFIFYFGCFWIANAREIQANE